MGHGHVIPTLRASNFRLHQSQSSRSQARPAICDCVIRRMQKRSATKTGATGSAKKARSSGREEPACDDCNCNPVQQAEEEDTTNVFSLEMDTLQCDICYMPFESQVYSCKNGHAACANCCITMDRKCPCCSGSIGDFRCRATEKIIAGMARPCRYAKNGCPEEALRFAGIRAHEENACRHAPYRCPFDGCGYLGLELYGHIRDEHMPCPGGATSGMGLLRRTTVTLPKAAPFRALLHRDGESVFLLLNGGDVLAGRSLPVVQICPYPDEDEEDEEEEEDVEKMETEYKMVVKGDEPGALSLTASGTVQFVRRLEGYKAKGFLFVPDDFWGPSNSVTVTVHL